MKSFDIIGLPIISMAEGKELGTVKNLVINSTEVNVAALVIDDGKWYMEARLLPFPSILGLGESAIICDNCDAIINISAVPDLENLLSTDIKIIGTKVLTTTGHIMGKVKEFSIDNTGKIVACEVEDMNDQRSNLDAQNIVTLGKSITIILPDKESKQQS